MNVQNDKEEKAEDEVEEGRDEKEGKMLPPSPEMLRFAPG